MSPMARDGLVLIDVPGGKALVDTGSPYSFGDVPSLVLRSQTFDLPRSRLLADVRAHTTPDLVALIGMDVLGRFDLEFFPDPATGRLEVEFLLHGETPVHFAARSGPSDLSDPFVQLLVEPLFGSVPAIRLPLGGIDTICILDTGAHVQYVHDEAVRGLRPHARRMDFLPEQGEFETTTYLLDVPLQGHMETMEFGTLPPLHAMTLSLLGGKWCILGTDFLRRGVSVLTPGGFRMAGLRIGEFPYNRRR